MSPPRITIFGPSPVLTVAIEQRGDEEEIHFHPGGQGVWVTRMAGEVGGHPILCGLIGGETGAVLAPLLEQLPGELRLVPTSSDSGCYVMDRRSGDREVKFLRFARAPSRHETDTLFSTTCTAALASDALVVCNPLPGDAIPLEVYENLVADVRENGTPVLVDLSTPRLDRALEGQPDVVKLNDWELAEFVVGPVSEPGQMRAAAERLVSRGARSVIVTRGADPALVLRDGSAWTLTPPRFERGAREGCGDSMMGALATCLAGGRPWEESLRIAAAAGAANFLRHGLGSAKREVVEELAQQVELQPV